MPEPVTHLVIISREGTPEVTEFTSYEAAARYFDRASQSWTESYLTAVVWGPGRPMPSLPVSVGEAGSGQDDRLP